MDTEPNSSADIKAMAATIDQSIHTWGEAQKLALRYLLIRKIPDEEAIELLSRLTRIHLDLFFAGVAVGQKYPNVSEDQVREHIT